jgi:NAD(P)-dependent dehydrogenase (short-subunit alcohol dehydrogenase family)
LFTGATQISIWIYRIAASGRRLRAAATDRDPDELAAAALYLASDASSFTSEATIRTDGGLTRHIGG